MIKENVSLLCRTTPNNLSEAEVPNTTVHKDIGWCCERAVLDLEAISWWVLFMLGFIPQTEHHVGILSKSLFKELAPFSQSDED